MGKCKRLLTMVLAAVLCCTLLPVTAFAGGGPEDGSDKILEYWSQGSTPPQDMEQTGQPGADPSAQPTPQPGEPLSQGSEFSPATCCTTRKHTSSSSLWRAGMEISSTS